MERRHVAPQGAFGALLRQYRTAANITQEELAERSGLSLQAVAALEQGARRSPRPSTVEWLAEALKLETRQKEAFVAAARGRLLQNETLDAGADRADAEAMLASLPTDALPARAPLPAGSRMLLAPNPLFVGRGDELLQVARALHGGDTTVALGQVVASTGLGGLGKTQMAVEFVHRYGRHFAGGVFWLSFASADEVPLQVAACAGPGFEAWSMGERLEIVKHAWQSATPRLLVFDNCEEEALLEAWRPTSGGCRVLVTSRRAHWAPTLGVTALPLDLLPRSDSIELLRRYRPDLAPDDPGLDAIAHELGDLPLALHLAGSYLRAYRPEVSLDGYLAELRRADVVRHASLLGAGLDDSVSPTHHVQCLAQTFALSLERLDRTRADDRLAVALLARMGWMAPGEPVPRELLVKTLEDVDPVLRANGLRRLRAVGLVEEREGWLRMHRLLVHLVRQESLDPEAQPAVTRALIDCGGDAKQAHLTGMALAGVIPHLVGMAGSAVEGAGDEPVTASLCNAAAHALQRAGDLSAARTWFDRALATRERVLGPDHPDTASSLNNLAELLWERGELAAARPFIERAVAIYERALGPDHPLTAQVVENLGSLLMDQGDLDAAKPFYERALTIRERALGPDHADTAVNLNNLAVLLYYQDDIAAAMPLIERAVAISERVLGGDHLRTATILRVQGDLLRAQGAVDAAGPPLERALAITEWALGAEHPETAASLNCLARQLHAQGKLETARPLFERGLAIRERVLGPNHFYTARSLYDLALLFHDQGDPAAARPLFERALAIRERVLGPDHPDTVATRRALEELAATGTTDA